jgi:hypothetical protein
MTRVIIETFERQFIQLHASSCSLVTAQSPELLYRNLTTAGIRPAYSMGEYLLRSAAAVERTFGGITANLWDDPFEWTLPENLSTTERVLEYLAEVDATRVRAFARFSDDADLLKEVVVPDGSTRRLADLICDTLVEAASYQGRAIAMASVISQGELQKNMS